jgi:hypothetical protein
MSSGHRSAALVLGVVSLLPLAPACSSGVHSTRLPDGSYELKCDAPLSNCLMQMEKTCKDDGYDVLRATEKRDRVGPLDLQTEIVRSEGIVRCRRRDALFSSAPQPSAAAPVAAETPPPLPDHAPLPPLHAPPAAPASSAAPPPSAVPPAPAAPPPPASSDTPSPPVP